MNEAAFIFSMTPNQKAKNLVDSFYALLPPQAVTPFNILPYAKQCALLAVNEILELNFCWFDKTASLEDDLSDTTEYWDEVKTELQNISHVV